MNATGGLERAGQRVLVLNGNVDRRIILVIVKPVQLAGLAEPVEASAPLAHEAHVSARHRADRTPGSGERRPSLSARTKA